MLVAILIGFWFNRLAKANNANQTTWVILGIVSYLAGQFALAIIIGLVDVSLLDNRGATFIIGIIGGMLGVLLAKYLLEKNVRSKPQDNEDDIIDSFIE